MTLPFATAINLTTVCGAPIFQAQADIATLEAEYHAFAATSGTQPNPSFIGSALSDTGPNGSSTNLFAPNYQSPRSVQMNIGIQREVRKGMIFTADFIRNVSTHTLLAVDTNHVGDARFLNVANATAAIDTTNGSFGCSATLAELHAPF